MSERKTKPTKQTKNRREQIYGFVHVSLFFVVTTVVCCFCLSYYSNKSDARKENAIKKMERIRSFQSVQSEQAAAVDSISSKIRNFNLTIQARYEEDDIKHHLNNIKDLYEKNDHDKRYKIFYQVADFYNMWFADKKELWSREQNIVEFKKNLEDCSIGLQKKKDESKNAKR